jgi:hypothetical protein
LSAEAVSDNAPAVKGPDGKFYRFPAGTTQEKVNAYFKAHGIKEKPAALPEDGNVSGDDKLTGFDLYSGHLETLSGKTFLIYRDGERTTAVDWKISHTEGQAQIHFSCKTADDCLIENPEKHQTIHGKLLR